ncbi:DUF6056 family protein [Phytobacter palmae]|uniref:DUF6056 family protein n=1 Tax=Phytobacter palmae TaxID=1855371 RepID=A0ABU9UZ81_9ENTR
MNANNKQLSSWVFYSSILAFCIIIAIKLRLMTYADDVTFSHALDNISVFDYLFQRYHTWSGRVVIEWIMVSTINFHGLWKIMIPACFVFSSYLVWGITLKDKIDFKSGTLLVMAAMLLLNDPVAGNAQWWVTGFYNYLLPMTCALFLMKVLLSSHSSLRKLSTSILLSFLATSSEQVAVVLIITTPFIYFISSEKRLSNKMLTIAYVAILAGSAVTLLSPGSVSRFAVEASRYMPQIADMNILQKALIGVDRLVENVSYGRNLCFIGAILVFLGFIYKRGANDVISKISVVFCVISFVICLTSPSFYMKDISYMTYLGKFYVIDFGSIKVYSFYLFYLLTLICMAVGSIENNDGERDYRAFITLMSGCVSTIAIGLSPTAYASGERVLYVFNVCLVLYGAFTLKRIIK